MNGEKLGRKNELTTLGVEIQSNKKQNKKWNGPFQTSKHLNKYTFLPEFANICPISDKYLEYLDRNRLPSPRRSNKPGQTNTNPSTNKQIIKAKQHHRGTAGQLANSSI